MRQFFQALLTFILYIGLFRDSRIDSLLLTTIGTK